jgi:hypothetical protein
MGASKELLTWRDGPCLPCKISFMTVGYVHLLKNKSCLDRIQWKNPNERFLHSHVSFAARVKISLTGLKNI